MDLSYKIKKDEDIDGGQAREFLHRLQFYGIRLRWAEGDEEPTKGSAFHVNGRPLPKSHFFAGALEKALWGKFHSIILPNDENCFNVGVKRARNPPLPKVIANYTSEPGRSKSFIFPVPCCFGNVFKQLESLDRYKISCGQGRWQLRAEWGPSGDCHLHNRLTHPSLRGKSRPGPKLSYPKPSTPPIHSRSFKKTLTDSISSFYSLDVT